MADSNTPFTFAFYNEALRSAVTNQYNTSQLIVSTVAGSHERLFKLIAQVTVILLSGWIVLITADKLSTHDSCAIWAVRGACALHVVVLALLAVFEFFYIAVHVAASRQYQQTFADQVARLMRQRADALTLDNHTLPDEQRKAAAKRLVLDDQEGFKESSALPGKLAEAHKKVDKIMGLAKLIVGTFFVSLVLSLCLMAAYIDLSGANRERGALAPPAHATSN